MDGVVDIWDYFYRQNEVAYSHKVGDCMLSSMAVQGMLSYKLIYFLKLLLTLPDCITDATHPILITSRTPH